MDIVWVKKKGPCGPKYVPIIVHTAKNALCSLKKKLIIETWYLAQLSFWTWETFCDRYVALNPRSSYTISCQVGRYHDRHHISLLILFKLDLKIAFFKILLEFKNGPCGPKNGPIVAHNSQKCFLLPVVKKWFVEHWEKY